MRLPNMFKSKENAAIIQPEWIILIQLLSFEGQKRMKCNAQLPHTEQLFLDDNFEKK